MAFVPFVNTGQAQIRANLDDQEIVTTLGFRYDGAGNIADGLQAMANGINDWWTTECSPFLPVSYQFRTVHFQLQDQVEGLKAESPINTGWFGSRQGAPLPNSNSLAIKFTTGQAGRARTGRNFWPGLTENDVTLNNVHTDLVNAIIARYLILAQTPGVYLPPDWTWVVMSKFANKQPRAVGLTTPISFVSVTNQTIDSARRRLPGRGR